MFSGEKKIKVCLSLSSAVGYVIEVPDRPASHVVTCLPQVTQSESVRNWGGWILTRRFDIFIFKLRTASIRDVNGSDTDGYCRYCICFHIFYRIRTRIFLDTNTDSNCFGYEYEYMCIEYGVNRMWIMSGTDVYSDIE